MGPSGGRCVIRLAWYRPRWSVCLPGELRGKPASCPIRVQRNSAGEGALRHVPRRLLRNLSHADGQRDLNPWTESKVNTKNHDRGPLLIIAGEKDHTVPWAIANAAYKRQRRNPAVTEIVKIPNRGHSLTIDHGWREVADTALQFVQRFLPAPSTP